MRWINCLINNEPHTVVFVLDGYQGGPGRKLIHLDVVTGEETYPVHCSDFFLQYAGRIPWVAEACDSASLSLSPTPTP